MPIQSLNPATEEVLKTFEELSDIEIASKIDLGQKTFEAWKKTSFAERQQLMMRLAEVLREQKEELAKLMALEMGKPLAQGVAEIEKCAWCSEFYAENAESFLEKEVVATDASESYITFEPLGIVLAVMPWNFPFWQVIRFIVPAAMAGNVGLLKHASNVPQCSLALEKLFLDAGFPEGVFQSLLISSREVKGVIGDPRVKAATLTGSERAGSQVAMQCGEQIKKTVLELGGSNPFLILEDADMDLVIDQATFGRFQNCGQSCIAAKRFVVVEKRAEEFLHRFKEATEKMILGDPLDEKTEIGPMSGKSGLEEVMRQVQESIEMGAVLLSGGKKEGSVGHFYQPTILTNVKKGMPVYEEETFGPIAAVIVVKTAHEAVEVANDTRFGLGASVFTQNVAMAKKYISELDTSCVFFNGFVKSDPRLPFGGVGISGYGRELSHYGLKEFVNIKTIWVKSSL